MDNHLWFPYTIGVSAGASSGISYASKQRGRTLYSDTELFKEYNYIGWKHFFNGRGYIDMHFLFYIYPEKYYPFDYDAYFKSPMRFVMVTSNCLTGKAEYYEEKKDPQRLIDICCASCTLPVLCPVAHATALVKLELHFFFHRDRYFIDFTDCRLVFPERNYIIELSLHRRNKA